MVHIRKFLAQLCLIFVLAEGFLPAQEGLQADPKIVFLIATPRSCSTVFLRMMEASRYFKVYNEPFICAYCKQREIGKS